jgi:hypothetical protein
MKHIRKFNESSSDEQSYKIIEDFIKEKLRNYSNPIDQEDLPNLLFEFGERVWSHLGQEGWGVSNLDGYKDWLRGN